MHRNCLKNNIFVRKWTVTTASWSTWFQIDILVCFQHIQVINWWWLTTARWVSYALNSCITCPFLPNFLRFLPRLNPSDLQSTMKRPIPWAFDFAPESVRAATTAMSLMIPIVIKILDPFRIQSSPSLTALVFIPCKSLKKIRKDNKV